MTTYLKRNIMAEEYDQVPVYYCRQCLSIKIKSINSCVDYCDECGSTDVGETDIFTWKKMYKEKYGKDY